MPPVLGSGRKAGWQRAEFESIFIDGVQFTKDKCKHCRNEVSRKLERLSSHLQRCVKYRSTLNNVDKNDTNNQNLLLPSSSTVQQSKTYQISLNEHVISTTPAKKVQIDEEVAKFFYANAISFNAANSASFKSLFAVARPGYKPPNRKQLAGPLLDNAEVSVSKELVDQLKECTITLVQDGWSSIKNDPIIASSIHTGTVIGPQTFLLNTVDCSSESKTAEYCFSLISSDIVGIKETYNKNVSTYCVL